MIKYTATKEAESKMPNEILKIGYVAISHHWVDDQAQRRLMTGRWVRIRSGQQSIYRVLRFNPQVICDKRLASGGIILDYDGWNELSGYVPDTPQTIPIVIDRSGLGAAFWGAIRHPDPTHRLACQLAYVSLVIALVSLVQAFCA
jgi:hypothetical protein